ncbi:hypothetical protein FACS189487_11430 [Campylobacterota bacterium]|nr:hypothetical protein FACS189487_11430 [Campylobacterota bacterium]
MPVGVANPLRNADTLFAAALIAPIAAVAGAAIAVYKGKQ